MVSHLFPMNRHVPWKTVKTIIWLVVWKPFYDFPYIGNVIIPTDEIHDFSEG